MGVLDMNKPTSRATLSEEGIAEKQAAIKASMEGHVSTAIGTILQEAQGYYVGAPRKIHPRQVRRGEFANRKVDYFESPEFKDLKRRIYESGGNTIAGIVVETDEVGANNEPIYELVAGHSRHQSCLELSNEIINGVQKDYLFYAQVLRKETPTSVRATLTKTENSGRNDTTPWEDGCWYSDLLEKGVFVTARAIAYSLGENEREIQRLVKVVREADPRLVNLIANEREIPVVTMTAAIKMREKSPELYEQRLKAFEDEGKKVRHSELFKALLAPVADNGSATAKAKELMDKEGKVLGTFQKDRKGGMKFVLDSVVKPEGIAKIAEIISKYKE